MSSVNSYFTFEYSQPQEYRFSHDSVFLSRRVFEMECEALRGAKILDLCAGCGIVGLDLLFHCREAGVEPKRIDFLEVQEIYLEHFQINARGFENTRFVRGNYDSLLHSRERYQLIVTNPPFFKLGSGKLSPSEFKNRCRFFMDSDFATLMLAIANSLAENGRAYILLRDFESRVKEIPQTLSYERLEPIRGTPLLRLRKNGS